MDPVTQGALGAVAAALIAKKKEARFAILIGWGAGMLADADIFIRSNEDPLLNIEYHRHFTHALLFIPVGALLATGGFWLYLRKWLTFSRIYLFALLGYATAGLLDACTSYGTRLLWPFSDLRVAWNLISIIDPVFTGGLLMAIFIILRTRSARKWGAIACIFALCYLSLGVVQNHRAMGALRELAISRGHEMIEKATVKPSIGNLILWRSLYQFEDRWYVDAVRAGRDVTVYEGDSVTVWRLGTISDRVGDTDVLRHDLNRFAHFSNNYLSVREGEDDASMLVIGDLRYAAIPNSLEPLWGIRFDLEAPDESVEWVNFRSFDATARQQFFDMVKGNE